MLNYPRALEELITALHIMPGIGQKTANRIAFDLIQKNKQGALQLARALTNAAENIKHCQQCRNLSEQDLCPICLRNDRDRQKLCVVETPNDLAIIEKSGVYQGYYFVLMGHLSPIDGMGPKELGLEQLLDIIKKNTDISEVILATNATVEGDSTAFLIREMLKDTNIALTRIAQGVPLGGELEMVDSGTIMHAFNGRQQFR